MMLGVSAKYTYLHVEPQLNAYAHRIMCSALIYAVGDLCCLRAFAFNGSLC